MANGADDADAREQRSASNEATAHDRAFDEFVARLTDEGASPEPARQAAAAPAELEAKRLPAGELLPGPSARWWQHAMFIMLGAFFAVLISVLFTAPAFHPAESDAEATAWGRVFMGTFFLVLVLFIGSGIAMYRKELKEIRRGYTTLRWAALGHIEVRDSRGAVIPAGDRRLTTAAKRMNAFGVIAGACVVVSPLLWVVRLVVG